MTNIQKRSLLAGAAAVLGSAGVMAATRSAPAVRNDPRELMRVGRLSGQLYLDEIEGIFASLDYERNGRAN